MVRHDSDTDGFDDGTMVRHDTGSESGSDDGGFDDGTMVVYDSCEPRTDTDTLKPRMSIHARNKHTHSGHGGGCGDGGGPRVAATA